MLPLDNDFRRTFFRQVTDQPLDPHDKRYVPLYTDASLGASDSDPVELMAFSIESIPEESVQLLSGFRGTGKTTELKRLTERLAHAGYLVAMVDVDEYLNLTTKVDVTDFLMMLAGAFSDALKAPHLLDSDPARQSYWTRLVNFLRNTNVQLDEIKASVPAEAVSLELKASLKTDPSFRDRLQTRMAGYVGALVQDVRAYFEECVRLIREKHGQHEVVFLVDSIEHIRGTSITAPDVQAALEDLFVGHADKLHLPGLHVIYTIHPYLKVRAANLSSLYEPGGVVTLPAVKVRERKTRAPHEPGLRVLEEVVRKRGDWQRLLGERDRLNRLILESGGHFRDLLRIIAEILRRADALPVSDRVIEAAVQTARSDFLPIPDADAIWLAEIARTNNANLPDMSRLPDLARFLDTHLVLCYWNGGEWYDAHPLVRDVVTARAAELASSTP